MVHKATIKVVEPKDVEVELTIRAKVSTLIAVRDALISPTPLGYAKTYPYRQFTEAIIAAVDSVTCNFVGMSETPSPDPHSGEDKGYDI